ncbi:MAG: ChbG/HpnK family deacetylase [Lachnospiraceae bacterium]|nr:ChbG/HpnK family deacetylase [Lachnospiraceae bacterium]
MKLIIRADDVGYTKTHNLGTWKVLDDGIATCADVMLDTPGTADALEHLREYPWISVGWHAHFWGSPVLPENEVPTLIDPERGHFRRDLDAQDISEAEALKEFRAELDRCIDIYGKAPGYIEMSFDPSTPFGSAIYTVLEEYGIVHHFITDDGTMMPESIRKLIPKGAEGASGLPVRMAADKWLDRKIVAANIVNTVPMEDSLTAAMAYDPVGHFLANAHILLERTAGETFFTAWHPGYLDEYVMFEGDRGVFAKNFLLLRPVDAMALCDQRMKDWIIANKVELVSMVDAIYGTRTYQNHLRKTGSPLAVD